MDERPFASLNLLVAWILGLLFVSSLPTLAAGAPAAAGPPPLAASLPTPTEAPPSPAPPLPKETPPPPPAPQESQAPAALPDPPPAEDELWIEVSVGEQAVRVYRGNELVRAMKASTGRPATPTPLGSFRLIGRGEWFYNPKYRAGGFWWVSFVPSGEYLFHSIPADGERRLLPEEARLLGQPASRGCVRLSLEDARWLYENAPAGTRVLIHAAAGPFATAFAAGAGA